MASLSTCHLGLWLGWQILLNSEQQGLMWLCALNFHSYHLTQCRCGYMFCDKCRLDGNHDPSVNIHCLSRMSVIPSGMNNSLLMTVDLSQVLRTAQSGFVDTIVYSNGTFFVLVDFVLTMLGFQCIFDIRYMIKSTYSLLSEITVYHIIIVFILCRNAM